MEVNRKVLHFLTDGYFSLGKWKIPMWWGGANWQWLYVLKPWPLHYWCALEQFVNWSFRVGPHGVVNLFFLSKFVNWGRGFSHVFVLKQHIYSSCCCVVIKGPAQDVPFFYTPSHFSELQSCKSIISTDFSLVFIFK